VQLLGGELRGESRRCGVARRVAASLLRCTRDLMHASRSRSRTSRSRRTTTYSR